MRFVREANANDRDAIHALHSLAFVGPEAETVARLACELLTETGPPATLSLVAEADGEVLGSVAFSPVSFVEERGLTGYLLAPLGVKPEHQKRGVGTRLVEEGVARLRGDGVDALLVYGDPAYYGRFGFTAANAASFTPPYELQHPFGWLAMPLHDAPLPKSTVRVCCVAPLCDPGLW